MTNAWQFSLLGYKARLLHPEYLLLAGGAAVLCAFLFALHWRRVRELRRRIPARLLGRLVPAFSPVRRATRLSSTLTACVLFCLALTQPQCGAGTELAKKMGIDVVVALDVSKSMLARDVRPSRLERAKLELNELIDSLSGDRFGLVVFAGASFVQCPLTTDYAAAKLFLRAVDPSAMPRQGTDIAGALRTARRMLLSREGARSRVVVLLTDGEDHEGGALDAARELAKDGIRVFAVGIGSPNGEPIPILDENGEVVGYEKDRQGNTVISRLDEATLKEIARITGGKYVAAGTAGAGVEEVVKALGELEKAEFEARLTTRWEDRSVLLLFPAFLLLLLGTVIAPGRAQRQHSTAPAAGRQAAKAGPGARGKTRTLAALLVLFVPLLGGAKLFETEHPLVAQGNAAWEKGDLDAAIAAYRKAAEAERDPKQRAKIFYNLGTALAAKGDVAGAREALQAALATEDGTLKARDLYNLGTALLAAGDPRSALDPLKRSLRLDPGNEDAKYNLELALRLLQQKQEQQKQDQQQQEQQKQHQQQ
ncbi:MAG: VWA domain-containing protein, partial [Deltaproteobacteria bacterium]